MSRAIQGWVAGPVAAALAMCASAQSPGTPNLAIRTVPVAVDSGPVACTGPVRTIIYSTTLTAPASTWVRVHFDRAELAGTPATETAAALRITSLQDGATQTLDQSSLAQWSGVSAYFNGPGVRLDLMASPGTGPSRVSVSTLLASDPDLLFPQDLCPPGDDRVSSADPRNARVIGSGGVIGSAFMINDTNRFFLTAGHIQPTTGSVVHFNVPASNPDGTINFPPPEDQYPIDPLSIQRQTAGTGNDWCYFGVFPNSNTGLQPPQVYGGGFYTLASAPPTPTGQTLRITGYGSTDGFNLPFTLSFTQTTSTGPYASLGPTVRYVVDTTGGNSGSSVEDTTTGQVIGIHYLAGCATGGNQATPINNANLQFALANPLGVTRTGRGTVAGNIYAIGDQANNFGTVSAHPTRFAKVRQVGARWQGMAFNPSSQRFFACDNLGLFTLGLDGSATPVGTITGAAGQTISGLGYDPAARVLYGIAASTGQLYRLDTATAAATPIGAPQGGTVTALEYDATRAVLWGIDNGPPQSRLVRIDRQTGAQTLIGNIGVAAINACHGLAYNPLDGTLTTIHAGSSIIYRLDPATGLGTNVGVSFGVFGAGFGMSASGPAPPCPQDFNGDGEVNPDDLSDFITCYFTNAGTPGTCVEADYNGDGAADPDDLSDYITAYFGPAC